MTNVNIQSRACLECTGMFESRSSYCSDECEAAAQVRRALDTSPLAYCSVCKTLLGQSIITDYNTGRAYCSHACGTQRAP